MTHPLPFGYLLEQPAAPNGYVFITVEQYATIKDEFQHLYKAVYAEPVSSITSRGR